MASTLQTLKGMGIDRIRVSVVWSLIAPKPTAPAPTWATPPRQLAQGYCFSHDPNAADFGQFVQAVGATTAAPPRGVRLAWTAPSGQPFYSRTAAVS